MDLTSLITRCETKLGEAGVASPRVDAELIISHVLKIPRRELYLDPHLKPGKSQVEEIERMVDRRARRVPLQVIVGTCEFMGIEFKIEKGVFIPRPETEVLVETIVEACKPLRSSPVILDIGTGSGVIAISLAHLLRLSRVVATDISPLAVKLARENAIINGVGDVVTFVIGDALEFFKPGSEFFDVCVCNPPYVRSDEIRLLEPEVRDYDPVIAIDGGGDGLRFFDRIIPQIASVLKRGGLVAFEIGFDQAQEVKMMLEEGGFGEVSVIKDLAGRNRVLMGKRL